MFTSSGCSGTCSGPTNARRLYFMLRVCAALLWVPHCAASWWVASTNQEVLHVLIFHVLAIALTYYLAVYKSCGDYLLIVSWAIGVLSRSTWVTPKAGGSVVIHHNAAPSVLHLSTQNNNFSAADGSRDVNGDGDVNGLMAAVSALSSTAEGSRLLWLGVSMLNGIIGGALCKLKDLDEDRYYPTLDLGARLYVVVPFCTGQWFYFLLRNGWRGILLENLTIIIVLAIVGYTVLTYKLLKKHTPLAHGDVIGCFCALLTTSFGVVFAAVLVGNIFFTVLVIPFLKSLFSLNALVSSLGIVMEIIVYEII
ncbi:uncharacterized protein TEOVI_000583700 [Trypanosoma equiperdum]|uniref:Uncharacterized protein n=2 Tax=Trypanozoon TaxID=39700 RepID=Q587H3_TRYB2|nr:hypothetical protein, conserved [Trypanosoma brucei brucei TREU927]AAQ15740.1 hypothetical protein, conserved [Trypanosoma brucei brucei TREU927]AAX78891.1 hypothetical protein, conserved [Trypanosoma brucei]SCU68583.1 hypothetical protein, conserved [Trypanosoma equiperdum]